MKQTSSEYKPFSSQANKSKGEGLMKHLAKFNKWWPLETIIKVKDAFMSEEDSSIEENRPDLPCSPLID